MPDRYNPPRSGLQYLRGDILNRKKKISDIYSKKLKKAKSHLNPKAISNKPKYISKADRAKMEAEAAESNSDVSGSTDSSTEPSATSEI